MVLYIIDKVHVYQAKYNNAILIITAHCTKIIEGLVSMEFGAIFHTHNSDQ